MQMQWLQWKKFRQSSSLGRQYNKKPERKDKEEAQEEIKMKVKYQK